MYDNSDIFPGYLFGLSFLSFPFSFFGERGGLGGGVDLAIFCFDKETCGLLTRAIATLGQGGQTD